MSAAADVLGATDRARGAVREASVWGQMSGGRMSYLKTYTLAEDPCLIFTRIVLFI